MPGIADIIEITDNSETVLWAEGHAATDPQLRTLARAASLCRQAHGFTAAGMVHLAKPGRWMTALPCAT